MGVDRRRVLCVSFSVFISAGCLGNGSLSEPFDLRIENQDTRPRVLTVTVDHVSAGTLYDQTHELDAGQQVTEPAVATEPGRYRVGVTDTTSEEDQTAEQHVELTTGAEFCGWFAVRADHDSVTATVPRCPNDEANETADGSGS